MALPRIAKIISNIMTFYPPTKDRIRQDLSRYHDIGMNVIDVTDVGITHTDHSLLYSDHLFLSSFKKPLLYVISAIGAFNQKKEENKCIHALDIGCGTGSDTIVLSSLFPYMKLTGLDISKDKCHKARSSVLKTELSLSNISFVCGDAANPPSQLWWGGRGDSDKDEDEDEDDSDYEKDKNNKNKNTKNIPLPLYDIIYAIESLRYLQNEEQRTRFLIFCQMMLKPGGRLVIIDRYTLNSDKIGWIKLCRSHGLSLNNHIDLTNDICHIWQRYWIITHVVLHYSPLFLLRWINKWIDISRCMSVGIIAEAFHSHIAEFGVLTFVKSMKSIKSKKE